MAKGPWRCNSLGIPVAWCDYVEGETVECVEDLIDRPDGRVFYRCNSAALVASGLPLGSEPNTSRITKRMFMSPAYSGEPVYRVVEPETAIVGVERKPIGFLDCPTSLQAWGQMDRAERSANQFAGKRLFTDPRSG